MHHHLSVLYHPAGSGDVSLDLPLPRLSAGAVARRLALPRAPQVHQLLRQGVRLHAAALHPVPGGLGALQDAPAPRQDQVLQVHLAGPTPPWTPGGRGKHGSAPEVSTAVESTPEVHVRACVKGLDLKA